MSFYLIKGKVQHLLASSFIHQIASIPQGAYVPPPASYFVRSNVAFPEESSALFREESTAVRLFRAFIHYQAPHYIDYCISDLIRSIDELEKPLEVRRLLSAGPDTQTE